MTILEKYSELQLLILDTSYRINRNVYPLLEKYDHLYVETHTYQTAWGIEEMCRRFGSDPLIFGTALPEIEGGCAIAQVMYAELADQDKQKIGGDNLRRLLNI